MANESNSEQSKFLKTEILRQENYVIDEINLKEFVESQIGQIVAKFGDRWTYQDAWVVVTSAFRHECTNYDRFLRWLSYEIGATPSREVVALIRNVYGALTDKFYPNLFDVVREVWREYQ